MNEKVGRNDICPCGSNKKYKKCCGNDLSTPIFDLAWQNVRQIEGSVISEHLLPYAEEVLEYGSLKEIIKDFFPDLEDEVLKNFFTQFGIPWILFNWLPEEEYLEDLNFDTSCTIAVNYLKLHSNKLNSVEKRFIEEMNKTYYSFYSIMEVNFERSLVVKDLLLGSIHTLKEKQGTHHLINGDVVFGRILNFDEQSIFIGMAPIKIPAEYCIDLLDFKDWLIEENSKASLTAKDLRIEFDYEVFDYFVRIIENMYDSSPPVLTNTDGDVILFSRSYFKLNMDIEGAVKNLLPLTLSTFDELLDYARLDERGKVTRIEFPWLVKGNKVNKSWKNTVMGNITISKDRLILETNSENRTQNGKELLKKYLGDKIQFQKTLLETPEQKMNSSVNNKKSTRTSEELVNLAEFQEHIKEMAKKHWEDWFDAAIPALNNQTPREASKTDVGRERLEALLMYYEQSDKRSNSKLDYFKADINYIKSELKL